MLRDSTLIFMRALREARREAPAAFVAPVLLSLFIVVIFDAVYGRVAAVPGYPTSFIGWVAPGAVLLSVFIGAGFSAAALVRDVRTGYLDRLRLLPVDRASLLAGRVASDAARALPPAALVLGLTVALGAPLDSGPAGGLAIVALAMVLAVAWNAVFYLVALATLNTASIQGLQPIFMPIVMFSTFWVPTTFMPGWYESIATHNPLTPVIDAARSLMLGPAEWDDVAVAVAVMIAVAALGYALVARRFGVLMARS